MNDYQGKLCDISSLSAEEQAMILADPVGAMIRAASKVNYEIGRRLAEEQNAAVLAAILETDPPAVVESET